MATTYKKVWRTTAAAFLALLLFSSCSRDNPAPEATQANHPANGNANGPQWIYPSTPHKPIAVVFIHGIFGDTIGSWTSPKGTRFFDLLHQSEFGDKIDIYAFGYTSQMLEGGSLTIDEAARTLHQYLQRHKLLEYDQIVFVGHSMGGLVAMKEITSHPDLTEKVPLMVLFATPQEGSQITAIAQHVVNNDAIRQMLLVDQNEFLKGLNNDWTELRGAGKAPRVICAYEKKPTKGVMIVPWSSATRNCDEAPPPIEGSDHISISKPEGPDDMAVVVLLNALQTYVMPRLDASNWQMSNVTPLGDAWVLDLRDVNDYSTATLSNKSTLRQSYRIIRPDNFSLHISPEADTRTVAGGGSDEIAVFPVGQLKPEYSFQLKLASAPPRQVLVRIPDMQAALEARAKRTTGLVAAINGFLGSQADPTEFNALSTDEKNQQLAGVAFEYASKTLAQSPTDVRWIVAADTLSQIGMSDSATLALQSAEKESPAVTRSATVRNLASVISAQSGNKEVFATTATPTAAPSNVLGQRNDLEYTTAAQRQQWTKLATKLENLPGLTDEALTIHGDVQLINGHTDNAIQLYQQAAAVSPTPVLSAKLARLHQDHHF